MHCQRSLKMLQTKYFPPLMLDPPGPFGMKSLQDFVKETQKMVASGPYRGHPQLIEALKKARQDIVRLKISLAKRAKLASKETSR